MAVIFFAPSAHSISKVYDHYVVGQHCVTGHWSTFIITLGPYVNECMRVQHITDLSHLNAFYWYNYLYFENRYKLRTHRCRCVFINKRHRVIKLGYNQ